MKETNKVSKMPVFGFAVTAAIVLSAALLLAGCIGNLLSDDDDDGDGKNLTFNSVNAFSEWYYKQQKNTPETPYKVKLNIKDPDAEVTGFLLGLSNMSNYEKYVYLDCSGSTFTRLPAKGIAGGGAFQYDGNLVGIILPNTVTSIESGSGSSPGAFYDCQNLTSVTLPINDGFTSIEHDTFNLCLKLTDITIPDSVTSIGHNAFSLCSSLTGITIPNSVTSIGDSAFSLCSSLTGITIPNSVTSMGDRVFSPCVKLTSITIGNSVTSIGWHAFNGCTSLTSVTIPDSVTEIKGNAFEECSNLASVTIGNSVTSIGEYAFKNCTSLVGIIIPDSVTSIGEWAFRECTSLTSVTFEGTITYEWFSPYSNPFPGDLRAKYLDADTGGIGTYTRDSNGSTWTKQ
jgi:hypothetical protein